MIQFAQSFFPCAPPEDDRIALPSSPGGYAWWYFDALSDDGRSAFVLIFYVGSVFSPRYLGRLAAGRAARPEDFCAVSLQWYDGGGRAVWLFQEHGRDAWRYNTDGLTLSVARSTLAVGPDRIDLSLDDSTPWGRRVQARFTFRPESPGFAPSDGLDAVHRHRWACVAPRARIDGALRLEEPGGAERILSFSGTGYHDVNAGDEPLWDGFNGWRWARAHGRDATHILYAATDRFGSTRPLSFRVDAAGAVSASPARLSVAPGPLTYLGLRRDAALRVRPEDGPEWSICPDALWENGPFYHRYRAAAHLPGGESVTGIAEAVFPQRLRKPWVRWMAACRAHRRERTP